MLFFRCGRTNNDTRKPNGPDHKIHHWKYPFHNPKYDWKDDKAGGDEYSQNRPNNAQPMRHGYKPEKEYKQAGC